MFRKSQNNEDSNFWISYADLMAGLLFVFILLIGAIISKSLIVKEDLIHKENKLNKISLDLKNKENDLKDNKNQLMSKTEKLEANDKILQAKTEELNNLYEMILAYKMREKKLTDKIIIANDLIKAKDSTIDEKRKSIDDFKSKVLMLSSDLDTQKNKVELQGGQIDDLINSLDEQKSLLSQNLELIDVKSKELNSKTIQLAKSEKLLKLNNQEIDELKRKLLASLAQKDMLSDKFIIVEDMLSKTTDELKTNKKELKDFKGKVVVLSNNLRSSNRNIKLKDEELLRLLNNIDEGKSKYEDLLTRVQSQREKIKSLTGIKLRVLDALKQALGSKIDIDKKTGSLRLTSNIFFDSGKSYLKPQARKELKKAFEIYIGTLINDPLIAPYLDKIIIEGHTDSWGGEIYNLELSQKRALEVMKYLVDLDFTTNNNIQHLMTASGRGESDLIYDKNGREDEEASRRIEIKFRLKNEDAISEIGAILDAK